MSLQAYLDRAYATAIGLHKPATDPVAACAADTTIPTAELTARLADLQPVEDRCIITKKQADFVRDVLAIKRAEFLRNITAPTG